MKYKQTISFRISSKGLQIIGAEPKRRKKRKKRKKKK